MPHIDDYASEHHVSHFIISEARYSTVSQEIISKPMRHNGNSHTNTRSLSFIIELTPGRITPPNGLRMSIEQRAHIYHRLDFSSTA
jgi:hypothetical protein